MQRISLAFLDLWIDALSIKSTVLLPLSNNFEFINFYKSVTKSSNNRELIGLFRIWLKCNPVEEIQEIRILTLSHLSTLT